MRSLIKLFPALALFLSLWQPSSMNCQTPVLTYHADSTRSGLYGSETTLTPANVNSTQFGKLFTYAVDGLVNAQPLYVPNVPIPGSGNHNVVYVVTQHDSVYAFDADNPGSGTPLWKVSFINPNAGITTEPIAEQGCYLTGFTEIGIAGTPVININSGSGGTTGTLYVVAKTKEVTGSNTNYVFRLHALDITTGLEQFGGPVVISASITAPNGNTDVFPKQSPSREAQRPALLLLDNIVYVGFGSNGCDFTAWGWLFAMDSGIVSGTLQQLAAYNVDSNQSYGASLWQSGGGPAGDSNGNVYVATANGAFDFSTGGPDLGDSILKFNYASGTINLEDYFTPYNQDEMDQNDLDLGSGGVMLLPPQLGQHPNLLVQSGKLGTIYVVDTDTGSMGGYNSSQDSCVQSIPGALGLVYSTPAYWNNNVYFTAKTDYVKGFALNNGVLSTTPTVISGRSYSGGIPLISANGSTNGILWTVFNPSTPTLYAFDPTSMNELYDSGQVKTRDSLGASAHFVTPIVANGRVYVGTQTQLVAYGLFGPPTAMITVSGGKQTGTVGTTLPMPLVVKLKNQYNEGVAGVPVNFYDGGAGGTFSPPSPVSTGMNGTASVSYTLPTKAKSLLVTASYSTLQVSLRETATAGTPVSQKIVGGNNQTGAPNTQLPRALAVQVVDFYGNPVPGVSVAFSDGNAGGTFSATPVTTAANGQASVNYTTPSQAGTVTITSTVTNISPVMFHETVQ